MLVSLTTMATAPFAAAIGDFPDALGAPLARGLDLFEAQPAIASQRLPLQGGHALTGQRRNLFGVPGIGVLPGLALGVAENVVVEPL